MGLSILRVNMLSGDLHGHDFDVEVEVYGSQQAALAVIREALPNHVWYRWRDLGTGENGRNQDVFPWSAEDWDETPRGRKFYVCDGLPVEDDFGPAPLYKNRVSHPRRIRTLTQLANLYGD